MAEEIRADQALIIQGLASSLQEARKLIMAGKVLAENQPIQHASQYIPRQQELSLVDEKRFVSRGGEKLQAALDHFSIPVQGWVCADVGASTGGFTDCLLQRGASKIYAIDVGYGLLDWKLRNHPAVVVMERTNARHLDLLAEPIDFAAVDVSFISLKALLPQICRWYQGREGQGVVLVKPQFEATREEAARGSGVITDPDIHQRVLEEVLGFAVSLGLSIRGLIRSPLTGPAGNIEFLAWLKINPGKNSGSGISALIEEIL